MKPNLGSVKPFDAGPRKHPSVAQRAENIGAQRRVHFEQTGGRRLQPVFYRRPDAEPHPGAGQTSGP